MYSTVLLDLDHTIFDSDASEAAAFEATLRAIGIDDHERYISPYQAINLELWAAVERGELVPQQVKTKRFERFVDQNGIDADPQRMSEQFVAGLGEYGELYDNALEVLTHLDSVASLALVTNGLSEVQRRRIERLDIGGFFDAVVISAEAGVAKPSNSIFELTFEMLNSPSKSSTVMVGDNLKSDIKGGADFGVATCWYNPSGVSATVPDAVSHEIRCLSELMALVPAAND